MQTPQSRWESIFRLITSLPELHIPAQTIAGRSVLITGAGGSIGATLADEVVKLHPRHLLLLDASEQSLYRLERRMNHGSCAPHNAFLGSVCDRALLDEVLQGHRPQVIFHAAAHKHVPLMEFNPIAALQNNAVGTFILAQSAARHGVEQVVIVSTDKAVEPVSMMGVSKRIAELVVLAMESSATRFKAVRLGNVLASEGSVLPLFQEQIDRGEPVTVVDGRASRYFLTMQRAARLLLLALSDEIPNGILVPEMGEPIRIEEIATRMLAASQPSASRIVFTGLRTGDKLTEKLVSEEERFVDPSQAPLRAICSPHPAPREMEEAMAEMEHALQRRDLPQLLRIVHRLAPGYQPSAAIMAAADAGASARLAR